MACLIFITLLCTLPTLILGILMCMGKAGQFINTGRTRMKKSFVPFCGIMCIILAAGFVPLSLVALLQSHLVEWIGLGVLGVGCVGLVVGTAGPWFRA